MAIALPIGEVETIHREPTNEEKRIILRQHTRNGKIKRYEVFNVHHLKGSWPSYAWASANMKIVFTSQLQNKFKLLGLLMGVEGVSS